MEAGLLRAATKAGMQAVAGTEHPDVTLHSSDHPQDSAPVDVCAELGRVTLTVSGRTHPAIWPILEALVAQLLGAEGTSDQ